MAEKGWAPPDPQQFFELRASHSRKELADIYGVTFQQVKHYLSSRNAASRASVIRPLHVDYKEGPESVVISSGMSADGVHNETRYTNKDVRSPEELMELYNLDPLQWQIVDFKCKTGSWDGFWKDGDNNAQTRTLYRYACEARFKPQVQEIQLGARLLHELMERSKDWAPVYPDYAYAYAEGDRLGVIGILDHHFGKLGYGREVGIDWDIKIAEQEFKKSIITLAYHAKKWDLARLLFIAGNDFINADGASGQTTNGTPQDMDSRYSKVYLVAYDCLHWAIDYLLPIAPIDVISVPGNHDRNSAFTMAHALQCQYQNCTSVTINNEPTLRKYYRWGDVLLGFTHGDNAKNKDLALLMAQDRKQDWGETLFRKWYTGHWHTKRSDEFKGVQVDALSCLCGPDAWHDSNGYTHNIRSASLIVWDKTDGLVGDAYYNIRPPRT